MLSRQCTKALWLKSNRSEVLTTDDNKENIFKTGHRVGIFAQGLFPDGVTIPYKGHKHQDRVTMTQEHISNGVQTIYEATFIHNDLLVMVDILHFGSDGWEIHEIKSAASLKQEYLNDAAFQYYVLTSSGLAVSKVVVSYINGQCILSNETELDPNDLFTSEDVTHIAIEKCPDFDSQLQELKATLIEKNEPDVEIGSHCKSPHKCEAYDYCWKVQRNIPDYSVFNIFNMGKKSLGLMHEGILNVDQIPDDQITTPNQRFLIDAYKSKEEIINTKEITRFLNSLTYPIIHLDFESYQQVIPTIAGTTPYQQIPFQYSVHVEQENGDVEHFEFLAEVGEDPRTRLAKQLINDVPKIGTVLVFNQTFEKGRLKELAEAYPQYSEDLLSISDRIKDLAKPFQKRHYYHPDMRGKHSIKVVMPLLVPDMVNAYKDLELVNNGGDAMNIFPELASMAPEIQSEYREALLKYCELDTKSMVMVLAKLRELVSWKK